MDTWRLLITPPARGAWNMALDEAILESTRSAASVLTLRLFAWDPPCLSLGQSQPYSDVDPVRLRTRGWDIVRRLTGGRAILHTDELTYSVIGPADEGPLAGTVLESYKRVAVALLAGLRIIGLPSEANEPAKAPGGSSGPICFEAASAYEITVQGRKLMGSAQARRKHGVLQHGSLPLGGDLARICDVLTFADAAARAATAERLLVRATTAETVLQRKVNWNTAAQAMVSGFESALGIQLQPLTLSASESGRADELVRTKYAHPSWTERI
jgi:lipoate-protein ligase A